MTGSLVLSVLVAAAGLGACGKDVTTATDLTKIVVLPRVVTLGPSQDTQFIAFGVRSNGDSGLVTPTWSSTAGTIGPTGHYAGPAAPGSSFVKATLSGLRDSAVVTVSSPVIKLVVLPDSSVVGPHASVQYRAVGVDASSDSTPATVLWSATGGVIDVNGSWTAPDTAALVTITATNGSLVGHAFAQVLLPSVVEPTFRSGIDTMALQENFSSYSNTAALLSAYTNAQTDGTISLDKTVAFTDSQSMRIDWANGGCLGASDGNVHIEKSVGKLDTHPEWIASYYTMYQSGYMFNWSAGGCSRGVSAKELVSFGNGSNTDGKWSIVAHAFGGSELTNTCPQIYQSSLSAGMLWGLFIDGSEPGSSISCTIEYPQHLAIGTKDPNSLADGAWHRITVRTRKQSAVDLGDGIMQMWVDGVLVMNYDGTDASSPAFHLVYLRTVAGQYAPFFLAGIFNGGSPQAQSRWFDYVRFWYRPN